MKAQADDNTARAILTDTTLCTGCETCVAACKKTYGLGRDRMWRWKDHVDSLSATRFCTVLRRPNGRYVRQQCRHCVQPACASACIVGALRKEVMGPVTYDSHKCMGCRYCMMACPYGIPRYEWESAAPKVRKCILCYPRLKEGKQPACTEACPYGATIFGTRAEMLSEARRRIRLNPNGYYPFGNPKIYGEHEVGGTSVLYISNIPLEFLSWGPKLGDQPLPALTWAALSKVPPLVLGVAGTMTGIYWIIGRRAQLQAEAAERLHRETGRQSLPPDSTEHES
jgi:formate dehydrogenase iron-sulfur subunit